MHHPNGGGELKLLRAPTSGLTTHERAPDCLLIPGGPGMGVSYLEAAVPRNWAGRIYGLEFAGCGPPEGRLPLPQSPDGWMQCISWAIESLDRPIVIAHSLGCHLLNRVATATRGALKFILISPALGERTSQNALTTRERRLIELQEAEHLERRFQDRPTDALLSELMTAWWPYYFEQKPPIECLNALRSIEQSSTANLWGNRNVRPTPHDPAPLSSPVFQNSSVFLIFGACDPLTRPEDLGPATPFAQNFQRQLIIIPNRGHFPWLPESVDFSNAMHYLLRP